MVYRSCVGIVNTRIISWKTNFFSYFLLSPWRVFACNNLHLPRPPQNDLLRDTRVFFFPFFPLLFLLLFIFYTAFIKNLLNIDFALVSPPAIWPQPGDGGGGGGRGCNCFVRRSNKNYKTFMYLQRNYTRQRQYINERSYMGIISIIDVDVFIIDVWCQPYGIANGRIIKKKKSREKLLSPY
jgi:hypothetical protein